MKENIKEYLETQINLSEELNGILKTMKVLGDNIHEELSTQKKEEIEKLNNNYLSKSSDANLIEDRLNKFQAKIKKLLDHSEVQKDYEFFYNLKKLDKEAKDLSEKVDFLSEKLHMYYDVYKEKKNNNIVDGKSNVISNAEDATLGVNNTSKINESDDNVGNISKCFIDNLNKAKNENESSLAKNSTGVAKEVIDTSKSISEDVEDKSYNESSSESESVINKSNSNNEFLSVLKDKEEADKKMEFKLGTNILNIIGVVLILIAFVTFGKYIYTNYMNDTIKGIALFIISSGILLSGELIFKKKLIRFSEGISALGVAALYVSVMINYLVLGTLSSVLALGISIIITGISLWISYVNNSDVIRILSLFGGYLCLYPMEYLIGIQSYITVSILIMINLINIWIPIKNKKFLLYSSTINVILLSAFALSGLLEVIAVNIYIIAVLIINNYTYAVSYKEKDDEYYAACFLTSAIIIGLSLLSGNILFRLICLAVTAASFILVKNELKILHFINSGLIYIILLYIYGKNIGAFTSILYCALMILTAIYVKKQKNSYLNFYSAVVVLLGIWNLFIAGNLEEVIYIVNFIFIIWFVGDKHRNNQYVVYLKHSIFGLIVFKVFIENYMKNEYIWILCSGVSIIYILIINNINRLKDDKIKNANELIIGFTFIFSNIPTSNSLLPLLNSLALGYILIYLFMNRKYTEENSLSKYKVLSYSLYTTYAIIRLFSLEIAIGTVYNLLFSIILMISALVNVWLGFKLNDLLVRRYGLALSLIVCGKLIIFDFSSAESMIKTLLFLIVGIIALIISYIYNKLEQELKNKKE